ncbi:Putative protein [Zobellia galactanivorans]|uniref:DinB-like domain-containing protein n=1 Tax=Zobellia galactanivorans (strain DSM 12802 / CCUG 47099 / CIP 106680 / NCIMB 13871 / Dsij) TaxID=63186 RepID=G0L8A7_ZOBGA|nr:Putative protein [Zobellia galactanivorans]
MIEKGCIISSPANKNIVCRLETAFDIIVTHEQRHFEQLKETYQLMAQQSSYKKQKKDALSCVPFYNRP